MAGFLVKNGHQKICIMMRLNYLSKIFMPFQSSVLNAIGRLQKEEFQFGSLSDSETSINNLCDLQLLAR